MKTAIILCVFSLFVLGAYAQTNCTSNPGCKFCDALDNCVLCNPGFGPNPVNASLCSTCPQGQYNNGTYTTCQACTLGPNNCSACEKINGGCTLCMAGYEINPVAPGHCSACPAGKWNNGTLTQCQACTLGPNNCSACNGATGVCTSCMPGYEINPAAPGNCKACASGRWNNGTFSSCQLCVLAPNNCSVCDSTNGGCLKCSKGYGLNPAAPTRCMSCPAGKWNNGTYSYCQDCALVNGCTSCENQAGTCKSCSPGFGFNPASPTRCMSCRPYMWNNGTYAQCQDCNRGFGCLECEAVAGLCNKCPAGKQLVSLPNTKRCVDCQPNTYSTSGTAGSCTACPMNGGCLGCYPATGLCTKCPPGNGLSADGLGCVACVSSGAGASYSYGSTACIPCFVGGGCTSWNTTTGICQSCPAGFGLYGGTCSPCGLGQYSSGTGTCNSCYLTERRCLSCDSTTGVCQQCTADSHLDPTQRFCIPNNITQYTSSQYVIPPPLVPSSGFSLSASLTLIVITVFSLLHFF